MTTWKLYSDRQSAVVTTLIRDLARAQRLEAEYTRIGWTTEVAVRCTDDEWASLLAEAGVTKEA